MPFSPVSSSVSLSRWERDIPGRKKSAADSERFAPKYSETSIPVDLTVQIYASIGSRDARSRRSMGVEPIVVFPKPVWTPIRFHLHPRQRERYVLTPPLKPFTAPHRKRAKWFFSILTGNKTQSTAASQMAQQMSQMNPGAGAPAMFQPGQDPDKMFLSEAENLEVVEHEYILKGIEDRLLATT